MSHHRGGVRTKPLTIKPTRKVKHNKSICDKLKKHTHPTCTSKPLCKWVATKGCFPKIAYLKSGILVKKPTLVLNKSTKVIKTHTIGKIKNTTIHKQDHIIVTPTQGQPKSFRFRKKIAAFDYDHTMVIPKTKAVFSKGQDDWKWIRKNVIKIVQDFYKKGYCIVIFTNQFQEFKKKQIENVLDTLGVPYKAYLIYNKTLKKPVPHYFKQFIGGKAFDKTNSFYTGDAGGRSGDHSDSDKLFAEANGLHYVTPEERFPFKIKNPHKLNDVSVQEMVLMVGYPGSGKSTFAAKNFNKPNYIILSGDELKTEKKIIKALTAGLIEGKSVVIDATFGSIYKVKHAPRPRGPFIKVAKDMGIYVRVVHINSSIELSMERNRQRTNPISKIVFYKYRKWFVKPSSRVQDMKDLVAKFDALAVNKVNVDTIVDILHTKTETVPDYDLISIFDADQSGSLSRAEFIKLATEASSRSEDIDEIVTIE
tara:strand:+ start:10276 stop:11712 length:1437 start_codon:yes stop_codon:yes gene_type:complete